MESTEPKRFDSISREIGIQHQWLRANQSVSIRIVVPSKRVSVRSEDARALTSGDWA